MTPAEIQKEWDSFIEYPEGSGKLYVTTTSALLFARCIADMAAEKEREACAELLEALRGMLALDEEHHQRGHCDDDVCTEVRKARAAIAKATGEQK